MLDSLRNEYDYEPNKEYVEREALRLDEMHKMKNVVNFGSHTKYHPLLINCSVLTEHRARGELEGVPRSRNANAGARLDAAREVGIPLQIGRDPMRVGT